MDSVLNWISGALNSGFTIAFVGGLVGAFGGALGAQHIAERAKRRDDLAKELRNTSAGIMVAFQVCNSALAVKRQHVQPMWEGFQRQKADLAEFKRKREAREIPPNTEFNLQADLKSFPAPLLPIDSLKKIVFEQISAFGRPLALVAVLEQSIDGLDEAIARRDRLVHRFNKELPKERFAHHYFGLRLPSGDTDQEYPDTVEVIHSYVDDVAFFSSLLCADLIEHGTLVRKELLKLSKKVAQVSAADFSGPRSKGLLPPAEQYADWVNGFRSHENSPS